MFSVTPNLAENDTVLPAQGICVRSFNGNCRRKRVIGGTASHLGKTSEIVLEWQYFEFSDLKYFTHQH